MKSALITGGSSGIGLAIAHGLREDGYALTLAARRPEPLEEAGAELGSLTVQTDVTKEEDCVRVVAAHVERHGGLDVLVNSAGVGVARNVADMSAKYWDLQQSVNLRGAFLTTREALPHLRRSRGHVINLASIVGTIPSPGRAGYGASKAALISLTNSLNREEEDHGVRATALCPAFVETRMTEWTGLPGEDMIQPEDCAEIVRAILRLTPRARVPQVVIERLGDRV